MDAPTGTHLKSNLSAADIAAAVVDRVGVVKETGVGASGAPVMVLAENHASRVGLVQMAIVLVRLHETHGLRQVALEGYLQDDPKLDATWFAKAAGPLSPQARARVATRLLREGEISQAEFAALIYDDLELVPAETAAQYGTDISDEAASAPMMYLVRIAERLAPQEKLAPIAEALEAAEGLPEEQKGEKVEEAVDKLLALNPWVSERWEKLSDPAKTPSIGDQLALLEEIESKAQALGVEVGAEDKEALGQYRAFLRGRDDASRTIVETVGGLADAESAQIAATTIGHGHSSAVREALKASGRQYALINPLALELQETAGDLTDAMFSRKAQLRSVFAEGLARQIVGALDTAAKRKPKPLLDQPWFQGKSELYLFTERIAEGVLGPPSPPAGGKPPFGFGEDDFLGRWVWIDPSQIAVDKESEGPDAGPVVIFKAVLNRDDPTRREEIWVKAGRATVDPATENETVEQMLFRAIEELQAEKPTRERAEDEKGRVRITLRTLAAFGETREAAAAIKLGI